MADTRIYFVIHANTAAAPSEQQWRDVLNDAATQSGTLARAIMQAARAAQNYISASKRSQNAAHLRRYTLGGFEIEDAQVDAAVTLLNSIAASRSINGGLQNKFEKVIQAELREAAVRQGFSVAQSNLIDVAIVGYGNRETAMTAAQAYLAANTAIWYE